MIKYQKFIKEKEIKFNNVGFTPTEPLNEYLFPFQKTTVLWALKKGRACFFEDCGLGKTIQQLEWAYHVYKKENAPVLIVAPLAVSEQTKEEGKKFGYSVNICNSQSDVIVGINITNYEKLHKFQGTAFCGVVLDESSILKNMQGKLRNQIIDMFSKTTYRLACTATPSPNDFMELGNHSAFLGIMSYSEMLSMFFINDTGNVGKWRLKKYAKEVEFWKWVSNWAIMITNPSDIGYTQTGFSLPKIHFIEKKIKSNDIEGNALFFQEVQTLQERRDIRKKTIKTRCALAADIVNKTEDQWLIWCGLNDESKLLTKLIYDAEEVAGSTPYDLRKKRLLGFANKDVKRLVTKPSIAGFGMNWQQCNKMIFVGLNDSWELFYQAIRRIWRFGQKRDVYVYIIIDEREGTVLNNIKRKQKQAEHMIEQMLAITNSTNKKEVDKAIQKEELIKLPKWIN